MDGKEALRPAGRARSERPAAAARPTTGTPRFGASPPHALLALQRRVGNRAVASVLDSPARARPGPPTRAALALLGGQLPTATGPSAAAAAAGLARTPDLFAVDARPGIHESDAVPVHDSAQSHRAAAAMGVHAYTFRGEVALGAGLDESGGPGRSAVLAHELAHARQTQGATQVSDAATAESAVQHGHDGVGADPDVPHGLFWLIPVAAAAYVLLRPNVANAPSPEDVASGNLQPSVSELQVAGEALALFAVPGGIASGLARAGYGVVAAAGVSGAGSAMAFRGVQDVGAGEFSGTRAYIIDAGTGAVIGVVVGGAVRIFGGAGGAASGQSPNLVHFTTPEAQAAIMARSESGQLIGQLRGRTGIWALTDDALQQAPWQRAARATMSTSTAQAPVAVPAGAAGQFSRAVPVGPVSGWQYAMGVYRAPAGSVAMASGQFTAAGQIMPNIRGLIFPYGADAALWISVAAFGLQGDASATAEERGIRTLLPSFPPAVRPVIESNLSVRETTRSDGPFVILPGMLGAEAAVAGAQGSYDPVAQVCHGPEDDQSRPDESGGAPPAVIYVAPFWQPSE
ncbi:DUF4157 domain-containing protein [Georgenia sp. MJ173]|uniref:eCIS core domain-containing protein n=1 Tax=Georgenia sunbinii TaxID=3117728 RepID=UPI002F263CC0